MWDFNPIQTLTERALGSACQPLDKESTQVVAEVLPFREFIKEAWHIIEPDTKFVDGWHIGAIAEFLEAITKGEIQNGIINIPPRCMKSTLASVLWQPWVWTFDPSSRWIFGSYDMALSTRDTTKARRIIRSDWYQQRWGGVFGLEKDQNLKSRFENTRTGLRLATAVEGHGTGEGGKYVVADDPHKAQDAFSKAALDSAHTWWTGTMATRSDDPNQHRRLIIMQRLAEDDLTGRMLATGLYLHLCLPLEFEQKIFDQLPASPRIPHPKPEEGEILWPDRFSKEAVRDLEKQLGPFNFSAQCKQLPTPVGGSIIHRDWVKRWVAPADVRTPRQIIAHLGLVEIQIHVDGRFIEDPLKGSFVVIAVWGRDKSNRAYLVDLFRERVGYVETKSNLKRMIETWPGVRKKYVEAKASGHSIVNDLKSKFPGMLLYDPGTASKVERLEAVSPYFASGNVFIPEENFAPWVPIAYHEIVTFPRSATNDVVDTTSQAVNCLLSGANVLQRFRNKTGLNNDKA